MLRKEHHTNTRGDRRDDLLIAAAGALPVVWIALKIALKVTGTEIDWEGLFENLKTAFPSWN